jgi:glycine hydroxymethyltransferase
MLVDLTSKGLTGKEAETVLDEVGITVNKNMIPFDSQKAMVTSGIRIGTPAITTRGMREAEMEQIAAFIDRALRSRSSEADLGEIRREVRDLCRRYPV